MSEWKQQSTERRDFRHMHDEPEVPRWRKKRKHVDKARCKHEYSEWSERAWKYPERPIIRTQSRNDGYTSQSSTTFEYENRSCKSCGKRQSRHRQITKFKHFHWDKVFFENEYVTDWKTRW